MTRDVFDQKVDSLVGRLISIFDRGASPSLAAQDLEEIATAVEELQAADEELREKTRALEISQQHYQQLFDFAPDGYLVTDASGVIRQANRAASSLLNLSQQDMVGKPLSVFVARPERRRFRVLVYQIARNGGVQDQDTTLKPRDSTPLPAALSVLAQHDSKGRVELLWLIRDIGERRRAQGQIAQALDQEQQARSQLQAAQQALAASEARYRAVGELIPYGIWFADAQGQMMYLSDSFLQLVGMTLDECKGSGWLARVPREERARLEASWNHCATTGCAWSEEFEILGADGFTRTIWSRGIPLRDEKGLIVGWGGRNQDITERKMAEEALRISEERLRVALHHSPFVLFNQDRDLKYTWVHNPWPGFRIEEMIGRTDANLFSPEEAARLMELKRRVLLSGTGVRTLMTLHRRDGVRSYDLSVEPLGNHSGQTVGVTCAAADITEHERERRLLRQLNEHLEALVEDRTREIQAMNIQLRRLTQDTVSQQEDERRRISRELHDETGQVLTALKMNLELLREEFPFKSEQDRKRFEEVETLADQAINEIRTLAQDLRPPALDAANLTSTLEGLCREFARRSHVEVQYKGGQEAEVGPEVSICLYRLLQEGLTNIYKHAQARSAKVVFESDAEGVTLSVEDDGVGFESQAALWGGKPGLGFVGMRERLQVLGGSLRVDSEPGRGTKLTAHIPFKEVE